MAALTCEICGGKLVGKPGGIFECDSCGVEYSTEWAKAKIQEIKGTVKVEGTVEVTGKVQVDGPVKVEGGVNIESLLKRGWLALEDEKWDDAAKFFDDALNYDAECGEAYLGKLCAELHYHAPEDIDNIARVRKAEASPNYQKALRFGDEALRTRLQKIVGAAANATLERIPLLRQRREQLAKVACGIIIASGHHTVGLKSDGTVVAVGENYRGQCDVSDWTDIVAVSAENWHSVGLKSDGTVMAVGENDKGQCDVSDWTDIVAVSAGAEHTVGLKSDGTVVAAGRNDDGQCNVRDWTDIVAISAGSYHTVGLKSDGTVVAVGSDN